MCEEKRVLGKAETTSHRLLLISDFKPLCECLRSGETKGGTPFSNQTLTYTHDLNCGKCLWNRKHRAEIVDGVLRTNGPSN